MTQHTPKTHTCGCVYGPHLVFCPLHSAAPDLLAALENVLDTLANITTNEFQHGCDKPARDQARAAIAKATNQE